MIPDDTFIFNHAGARSNFDDHEVRLRHLLGQDAMPTSEGDRHLLYGCPVCKRPWYKAGKHEYPRLTAEQLAYLGAALHTDVNALHLLPRALCPICSTVYLGGMFTVGEYAHHRGYRFLWESASPRRIRLLAMVCRREGLTLDLLVQMSLATRTKPRCDMRAVLAWLETGPFPEATRAYTDEQNQHLAQRCPLSACPIPVRQPAHCLACTGASHAHGAVRRRAHDHHFTDHPAGKSDPPAVAGRPGRRRREWAAATGVLSYPWRGPS